MGECNHEMPGLPYPGFRMLNTEPGGGKPSPYTLRNSITTYGQQRSVLSCSARALSATFQL